MIIQALFPLFLIILNAAVLTLPVPVVAADAVKMVPALLSAAPIEVKSEDPAYSIWYTVPLSMAVADISVVS